MRKKKQRHLQGLLLLKSFKNLLTSIQQHRGLSMGYLNGDSSLLTRTNALKDDIDKQIKLINQAKGWTEDNLIWVGICDHWLRLSLNYSKYDSDHNFRQHCNLIINLLNLIEDCADNHQLQELLISNSENANFLWSQLLTTSEHIGQVRAIGTSIAAAKLSTSTQRIKLNYLHSCINLFLEQAHHNFDTHLLQELVKTTNEKLLIDKIDISAEVFFNLATSALSVLLDKFDLYLDDLKVHVEMH